jgi:hypothetical protein
MLARRADAYIVHRIEFPSTSVGITVVPAFTTFATAMTSLALGFYAELPGLTVSRVLARTNRPALRSH